MLDRRNWCLKVLRRSMEVLGVFVLYYILNTFSTMLSTLQFWWPQANFEPTLYLITCLVVYRTRRHIESDIWSTHLSWYHHLILLKNIHKNSIGKPTTDPKMELSPIYDFCPEITYFRMIICREVQRTCQVNNVNPIWGIIMINVTVLWTILHFSFYD